MNLIAILRGIEPDEAESVADILTTAGIRQFEVTMNSPSPLVSIERMVKHVDGAAEVGAGTVLGCTEVDDVRAAGGSFIVSPNCNTDVIRRTREHGMASYPGAFTASECFTAIDAGCSALKIFPASVCGPDGISALRAVLPVHMPVYAVGGVTSANMPEWANAGVSGVGIGSALYKSGKSMDTLQQDAELFVQSYEQSFN